MHKIKNAAAGKISQKKLAFYFFPLKNPKWASISRRSLILTLGMVSEFADSIFRTKK
jgi:hypothetical protein